MMLAHYSGQVLNASEIGRSLGEAHTTVKRHLDLLCGALVVRQLQPWFENVGKRQVKVYVRDSGILHALLGVPSDGVLQGHPKVGAVVEGQAQHDRDKPSQEDTTRGGFVMTLCPNQFSSWQ